MMDIQHLGQELLTTIKSGHKGKGSCQKADHVWDTENACSY